MVMFVFLFVSTKDNKKLIQEALGLLFTQLWGGLYT